MSLSYICLHLLFRTHSRTLFNWYTLTYTRTWHTVFYRSERRRTYHPHFLICLLLQYITKLMHPIRNAYKTSFFFIVSHHKYRIYSQQIPYIFIIRALLTNFSVYIVAPCTSHIIRSPRFLCVDCVYDCSNSFICYIMKVLPVLLFQSAWFSGSTMVVHCVE